MTLRLRPASPPDARFIWECRNDPITQASSLSTEPIPYDQHISWFGQHSTEFQVAETSDGSAVGYGRFADGTISVSVHPVVRRLGFGTQIVQLVSESQAGPVTAWIRPENQGSQRAFTAAGYSQIETITSSGILLQRWEYQPCG